MPQAHGGARLPSDKVPNLAHLNYLTLGDPTAPALDAGLAGLGRRTAHCWCRRYGCGGNPVGGGPYRTVLAAGPLHGLGGCGPAFLPRGRQTRGRS